MVAIDVIVTVVYISFCRFYSKNPAEQILVFAQQENVDRTSFFISSNITVFCFIETYIMLVYY